MDSEKIVWKLDPAHSELNFKVRHLMISYVKGEFQKFDGQLISKGDDFDKAKIKASVDARSIYTNNPERDEHLRSMDFFDANLYKKLKFKGISFEKLDDENYKLTGLLTLKGTTNKVVLEVDYGGIMTDPAGQVKAGFAISGKINRKDWGLKWNAPLGNGGMLVSDEVRINGEFQFIKQA